MQFDYIKNVMKFIQEDAGLKQNENSPEWNDYLEKLGRLINAFEEYYTPDDNNNYKNLDDGGKERIEELFKNAIKSGNAFLEKPYDLDDALNDKVRKGLINNINKEFLSEALVEFQNAEVNSDKSLKYMMDNFRNKIVPVTGEKFNELSGALSTRTNLTIEIDGQNVEGVFTQTKNFDIDKERSKIFDDLTFRYPKFKVYFDELRKHDDLSMFTLAKGSEPVTNGRVNFTYLNDIFLDSEIPEDKYQQFWDDEEFVYANAELVRRVDSYTTNYVINVTNLGLKKGDNIDRRNSAMSGVAHILNKDDLLAKSRSVIIETTKDGHRQFLEGTFMEMAKGKDIGNLKAVDKLRETKPEDLDTVEAKKSLANLQVIDYICGNIDRHAANMFYQFDPVTNKLIGIQGIDNDSSFLRGDDNIRENVNNLTALNFMKVIDEEMALQVLALDKDVLKATLLGYGLSKEEIDSAWNRTNKLQEAIKRGIRFESEKKINQSINEKEPYITIMAKNDWEKVSLNELGKDVNNVFNLVTSVFNIVKREAFVNPKLEPLKNEKVAAFNSKLKQGDSFYQEARAAKPLFGTSTRYHNVLHSLFEYQEAKDEEAKMQALDEMEKYVDIYKAEKRRDGVLDEHGNLLTNLSGKDLARVNLVDRVDNFVKTIKIMKKERDEAVANYQNDIKKVDEINATYRLGKYKNYAKCYRDDEGKILVDREILNRDETVNRDMVLLTEKMLKASNLADTSNDIQIREAKQTEYDNLKTYRTETVNNLKSQLTVEYNYGRIPKEYYDFRMNLLDNNIFGETAISDFAAADPNSPVFANTFEAKLKKDVDDAFIDNDIENIEDQFSKENELNNEEK